MNFLPGTTTFLDYRAAGELKAIDNHPWNFPGAVDVARWILRVASWQIDEKAGS